MRSYVKGDIIARIFFSSTMRPPMITPSVHQHCRCAQMRKPSHLATLHSDSLPPMR
ncbi:hypothetical protein AB28_4124 [Raoultella ornithinolytica 2-156-04_S1_C2]|nr:hypothetical protein AB28_5663 [Raoultella ornithinolytica 2-156-04_S1_C2]KDX12105.1 hypothetical protein AB28_4124 [Raoultella ornithinolytica 2-156-04_S1_C2]